MTPATSLGFEAVEFADWVWSRLQEEAERRGEPELLDLLPKLLEWQRWLLIHALELLPGPEKIFRFRIILLLVARQNGKTVILIYLILWRLFNDGAKLIIGTAQTVDIAEEAWETVVAVAEAIPELEQEIAQRRGVTRRAGKFALALETRERYKLAAASRKGGRGLSGGELVIMDELREHQTWASWSAVSKTTMARERGQVWGVSNAGDMGSIVLRHLRNIALALFDDGIAELKRSGVKVDEIENDRDDVDESAIGIFEWSAGPNPLTNKPRSVKDRDGWALANPSMGYSELSEKAIAAAASTDPEWEFRTEVMCDFVNSAGGGPFPTGSWEEIRVEKVVRDTERTATYCVDLSHDRTMAHIALAFWDTGGRRRVEIAASRAGTEWIIPWLLAPQRVIAADYLTLQTNGAPVSSLIDDFGDAGIALTDWGGPDLAAAHGKFYDAVRRSMDDEDAEIVLTHGDQPNLDLAAATALIKPLGDGWAIDRKKSPEDASPLVAVIGAHWLLLTDPVAPTVSAYEERGLFVV